MSKTWLALDESVRRYDPANGHLHIKVANISKATVNPYKGDEIPGWKALGLDPGKVYKLLRHPDELELGAKTFAGKPLLIEHKPVSANDHPYRKTIGFVGEDARYEHPYVKAALTIWPKDAIDLVEKCEQRELSCGYAYTPDMTPGEWEGEAYDGIMRDIVGNHAAIVQEGRAGPDVVIGDSMNQELKEMSKKPMTRKAALVSGAVKGFVLPRLAQDAKINLDPLFLGITHKNFPGRKEMLLAGVAELTQGKLAQDASTAGLKAVLDALEPDEPKEEPFSKEGSTETEGKRKENAGAAEGETDEDDAEDAEEDNENDNPAEGGGENSMAAFKEWLKGKLGEDGFGEAEERLKAIQAARKGGGEQEGEDDADNTGGMDNEGEKEMERQSARDRRGARDRAKDEEMVSRPAMDAALRAATSSIREQVQREARDLREAERIVRPYVGELTMACDSAEKVYRQALKIRNVKGWDTIHVSALRPLLEALPTKAEQNKIVIPAGDYGYASDSAIAADDKSYEDFFGSAPSVRQ